MPYILFFAITAAWLGLDLATKSWIASVQPDRVPIIPDLLSLNYQQNPGIAFSISVPYWVQVGGSVILIGLLLWLGWQVLHEESRNKLSIPIIFGIIIGGAVGNLINRIQLGYVIDFITVGTFPTFNFADIGITVGLLALLLKLLNKKHERI